MDKIQEKSTDKTSFNIFKKFKKLKKFKKPSKNLFWAWIAYQSVKGTLTLSFIWVPLFYFWFFK